MRSVKLHKYAQPSGTQVFTTIDGVLCATLRPQAWIGVLESSSGWYRIISAQTDGWVKMNDCVDGCHFDLQPALLLNMDATAMGYRLSEPLSEPGMCTLKITQAKPRRSWYSRMCQMVEDMRVSSAQPLCNISGF